ncbi:DUF4348 domain-containing protein [Rufibacter sp. LB8]|uniref:DUF4348 domain-containing protein n=1 Tax=Rufibacter sp. LB8 TaxID=2777781 RepID=UPI00178C47F6|nr:DUF4348 domain-containing protein [Rufibacter sp. LB8]
MKKLYLLILPILFIGCSDTKLKTNKKEPQPISNSSNLDSLTVEAQKPISEIPSNVDDKFETFLKYFNEDSIFQVSRIDFPIKVKFADSSKDYEMSEEIIPKQEFLKLDFTYDSIKSIEYEQIIEVKGDKATIGLRGIENGIMADFYFKKKNGKWMLETWEDAST